MGCIRVTAVALVAVVLSVTTSLAVAMSEVPSSNTITERRGPGSLLTPDTVEGRSQRMRVLDADARIFHYPGFLTEEECDEMRKLAEPKLDERRYYWYTDFKRGDNSSVIPRIEQRIADWVLIPQENFEGLRLTRYPLGRKFHTHWDNAHTDGDMSGGAQYATVLMYLSTVEKGGETIFPLIPAPGGENVGFSECARNYLALKPRKGDALLFHGVTPNGEINRRVMHDACPVEKGDKWSMQQFIRVGHFSRRGGKPIHQTVNPAPVLPYVDCPDLGSSECKGMSQAQCHSHRDYYIGNVTHPGSCLSRCMRCDIWREHLKLKAGKGEGAEAAHPRPQT